MGEHHKSHASHNRQNAARDARIIAQSVCPRCHAPAGTPCRNPVEHQAWRGAEDHRAQPTRPHNERKAEWVRTRRHQVGQQQHFR